MCATTTKKGMSFKERLNLEKLKNEEIARIRNAEPKLKEKHKEVFKEYLLNLIIDQLKRYDWSSDRVYGSYDSDKDLFISIKTFAHDIIRPIIITYVEERKCDTTPALDLNDQMMAYYGHSIGVYSHEYCLEFLLQFLEFLKENKIIVNYNSTAIRISEPKKRRSKKESKKNGR